MLQKYRIQLVELRRVPESQKEFSALTEPELKRAYDRNGFGEVQGCDIARDNTQAGNGFSGRRG